MSVDQILSLRAASARLDARRALQLATAIHWAVAATTHEDNQRGWTKHLEALESQSAP